MLKVTVQRNSRVVRKININEKVFHLQGKDRKMPLKNNRFVCCFLENTVTTFHNFPGKMYHFSSFNICLSFHWSAFYHYMFLH